MSTEATQPEGTENTEAPATEAEQSTEPKGLNQLLEELPAKEKKTDEGEEDTQPDAAAPKPPKESKKELAKKATAELSSDDIFKDEALATPEGIKRAREIALTAKTALEDRHRRLDSLDLRLKGEERQLKTDRAAFDTERERMRAIGQSFMRDIATIRGQRTAAPVEIMATFDRMAGGTGDARAGIELLEAIQIAVGRDGKPAEKSRTELEWERKFQELAERDKQREERLRLALEERQASELEQTIEQEELRIGGLANNPANFPGIAGFIAEGGTDVAGVGKWVADALEDARARGEVLDIAEVLSTLESKLAKFAGAQRPAESGREAARASAGAKKSTVLSDDADRSTGRGRKLTHEERLDAIARDPAAMKSIFGKAAHYLTPES